MGVFGRLVIKVPSDPQDFLTTLGADLVHDTTERLGEISAPSLIIGGSEDPFYSEDAIRETAEKIPDATLRLYDGVGHGVPKERKRRYEQDALAFLEDHRGRSSGKGDQRDPLTSQGDEMKRLAYLLMLLIAAVLGGACGMQPGGTQQQEVGKLQRESKSVDPKNAQTARTQLKMGAGELNLTGGADQLMEGDFSYNVSDWKPKVSYDVSGERVSSS